jgi:hypothetical protein
LEHRPDALHRHEIANAAQRYEIHGRYEESVRTERDVEVAQQHLTESLYGSHCPAVWRLLVVLDVLLAHLPLASEATT